METRGKKRRQPALPNGMEQPPETSGQSSAKAGAEKRSKRKVPASEDEAQPEEFVSTRDIKDLWKEMGYSVLLEMFRHFEMNKRFEMSRVSKEWNTVLLNTALLTKHYLFVEDDAKCGMAIQHFQI
ncbi:hypothetical protein RvY_15796 [Ramazzottius varieornatus]|uniref:F-box domain-containing protein n=1 Tax=Ramazzottius varieornatus TaxID=947166 RepID=A0A1D1W2W0_RAMVA|nr:hypothetical protein RvY_15796 [Ramazzottius varieornatus]